ncbi:hypothetical protein GCM10023189_15980 [Nibrella saemangeumensis]|uniref:DAPG hydrolase PhiG domain-containing protein n=1 Tax=Nibrella saemangeumensis TaxID=1084526 RepID=A0ABP8MNU1_9BACT
MHWKLPQSRPFGWTMKTLDSAQTSFTISDDQVYHLHIDHDLIRGVTPAMLDWWFRHIGDMMLYKGQVYPAYQVWHPIDHIHWALDRPAPDGYVGVGARFRIVEAFGGNMEYLIDSTEEVVKLDTTGIRLVRRMLGVEVFSLEHQFIAVADGTQYISDMVVGTNHPLGRYVFNRLFRPWIFTPAMGPAWLKHNIEEVGNFEYFLPELYHKRNPIALAVY